MAQTFWSISRKNTFLADQSLYSIFLTIQRVLFSPMLLDTQINITLLQSSQAFSACPSHKSSIKIKMFTDHRWNDTDSGKIKY